MIKIERIVVNMIQENCYVVSDETNKAVIIDCGAFFDSDKLEISEYIKKNGLVPVHHICTHGHFDHIMGSRFVFDAYGLKPELTLADNALYKQCNEQLMMFAGVKTAMHVPETGEFIDENSHIEFGMHTFEVIATPGHTLGGVSFYCKNEKVLFSGDSLFYCSIGRTDFPYGDEQLLIEKLNRNILILPDDVKVFPGHGKSTYIGFEKAENPYLFTHK